MRDATDPESLVAILREVAEDPKAKASERIAAVRELLDRGYGKAPAFAAMESGDPLELDAIATEAQAIADELRARRDARDSQAPEVASG